MKSTLSQKQAQEIAHRFRVHYEIGPESTVLRDHTIRQVGFRLDLYGGGGGDLPLRPGDKHCREIHRNLHEIALWIASGAESDCCYQIDGTPSTLYYGSNGNRQGMVRVGISILHRHEFDRPVDAAESRALGEMEDRLGDLGVHRGGVE